MPESKRQREISKLIREAEAHRKIKINELIQEYDSNVYHPLVKALRKECSKLGHYYVYSMTNPVGLPVYDCGYCHSTHIGELPKQT